MIYLIAGEKGGTGKSTIATNLAVHLATEGADVMLLDADPQGTASKWIERRNAVEGVSKIQCVQKMGDVFATAKDLADRYQYVIIDAGGRDSKEFRTALVAADKVYVPIRASQADLETLPHVAELVGLAKSMNPDLKSFALLSLAPSNPSITEVRDAQELLHDFPELTLSRQVIRDRKVYRDALLEGLGVVEKNNSAARAEIQLLAAEVIA